MCPGPRAWIRHLACRTLAAAAGLVLLGGCASTLSPEPTVLIGSANRVLLLLPLNLAAGMPPELDSPSAVVWKELELYLRAQGKELKTVSRRDARELWIQSVRRVRTAAGGTRTGYEDAARALALELGRHAAFDTLVAPSLFVREATVSNRFARWDGVQRKLVFEARGLQARGLASTPLEGVAPAASFHVSAFDARGERLHEGLGGLELLVRVRVLGRDASGRPGFQFEERPDLFENREHLREGIGVAFDPFLPPLPEPAR